jgi:ABC-type multidrug transport system permease subunit
MRFVYIAALKDLQRRIADPAALVIWIGIPLVLAGMLNFISGTGGNAPPRAKLLIVDQDKTTLSGLIPAAARQGNAPIDVAMVALEDGRRTIGAGDATALLVIPAGFQSAVLGQGSANLQLVTNPAQQILPVMVQQPLEILTEAAFYGQRLFGEPIRRIADGASKGPPTNADIASIAVEINRQITAVQGSLLPPVISVTVKTISASATPTLNFGQLFLPGMLFMSFLFVAQGMSADVWDEKRQGTLRRLLTTPQTTGHLLLGKLLAALVLATVIALIGLLAAVVWFGLAWSRIPLALLWCVFASGALVSLLTLLHTAGGSQRGGEMLSSLVVFPLMMLGGSFFPFEAMPKWMATAGQWTPNGLAVARLKDLLYGDPSVSALAVAALGIGIPAAAAFALARRRVRSFANA